MTVLEDVLTDDVWSKVLHLIMSMTLLSVLSLFYKLHILNLLLPLRCIRVKQCIDPWATSNKVITAR